MMRIQALCWDEVEGAVAIWPSPVDHDACFQAAGFVEFADSDEIWDEEFEGLLHRVIAFCSTLGRSVVKTFVGSKGVHDPAPADVLLAAASNDQFRTSIVGFGPTLNLITADGHPILWLCGQTQVETVKGALSTFAGELPLRRITLDWPKLMPEQGRTSA
jgi:hypothetical protein